VHVYYSRQPGLRCHNCNLEIYGFLLAKEQKEHLKQFEEPHPHTKDDVAAGKFGAIPKRK
jgi:hypothetical protein